MNQPEGLVRRLAQRVAYQYLGLHHRDRPHVFGIGLSKTGTTSLNEALNLLGYRAFHLPPTARVEDGTFRLDWPWWMNKYDAATDITVAVIFEELYRTFPKAKFVYTVREKEAWLSSCRKHFTEDLLAARRRQKADYIINVAKSFYGSNLFERELFSAAYDRFDARVQAFFRDKDLLVMDITRGDGWDTLCPFLGRPVPATPFPRSNVQKRAG
jgi:hypothetical protein